MTTKEKAKQLKKTFGKKAKKVAKELLKRDIQWIDHLSSWYPGEWNHASKEVQKTFKKIIKHL